MTESRSDFLDLEQELAVVRAIREAERGNHGEVRVHLEATCRGAAERARRLFRVLGLERTLEGTGVLLYVAVESGQAAIQRGRGLEGRGEDDRWARAREAAERGAQRGELTAGLSEAISEIGELLRELVPGADLEGSELADRVTGPADDPDRGSVEGVLPSQVHELIEIADGLRQEREDELTLDDLRRIAAELGIDDPYLEEARRELERRQGERRRERARRRGLWRRALIGLAALALLLALVSLWGHRGLRHDLAEVERLQAQVGSVLDRQREVTARYGSLPDDPEKRAVLAGAENRVAVERRRLDAAVARYNARAGSFPGSLWAAISSLPASVPSSEELSRR